MIKTLHVLRRALRTALPRRLPVTGLVTGFTVLIERRALRPTA